MDGWQILAQHTALWLPLRDEDRILQRLNVIYVVALRFPCPNCDASEVGVLRLRPSGVDGHASVFHLPYVSDSAPIPVTLPLRAQLAFAKRFAKPRFPLVV